jgi:hypothetical protein
VALFRRWRRGLNWRGRLAEQLLVLALAFAALLPGHAPVVAAQDAPVAACQYAPTQRLAQVADGGIREASALVASQQWPGVYWTLNDSGNAPVLYAFDQYGAPRGAFRVSGATNVDWEALQLGPDGAGGYALYIGDIGDNDQLRSDPVIYRVPEPEPAPPGGRASASETAPATTFRFVFPGRAHNAEAMLVHPMTGEVVLISREVTGLSLVYRLPPLLDADLVLLTDFVDVVEVRTFDPASGQVTDAAVSADGRHVALRTYASALMYDVPDGASLATIWEQQPRVYPLGDGPKGEGITFGYGTDDLMTVGEERPTMLYRTPWRC